MIVCDESPQVVWNVFFHFSLDDVSYASLKQCCHDLAAAAVSLESWKQSQYGKFLKFSSSHTLSELRRYWELYEAFDLLSLARRKHLEEERGVLQRQVLEKSGIMVSVCRSAGVLWPQAMGPVDKLFRHYWKTGTLAESPEDFVRATQLNPTFAYNLAGESFAPHYGTFPTQAFHLMAAYAPVISGSSTKVSVVDTIQEQFRAWSLAFKHAVEKGRVVVRFCVGDALNFCHALSRHRPDCGPSAGYPLSPLSAVPIVLDGVGMPVTFDVIDTSNLMDHLGLLNILICTRPLLKPLTTSVVYTEALLPTGKDAVSSFMGRLCGDAATVALLLDLAPRSVLSGVDSRSNVHEIVMNAGLKEHADKNQFHERVVWCAPTAGDTCGSDDPVRLTFEAIELGDLLFSLYDQLLQDERVFEHLRDPDLDRLRSINHYNRATFAMLIRLAKAHIVIDQAEWDKALDRFMQKVQADRSRLIGINNLQDLLLQLHLQGVDTARMLKDHWRESAIEVNSPIFRGWPSVPPVVCVVLLVPHARLDILGHGEIGSFPLICNLVSSQGHSNTYSCTLLAVPGKLVVNGSAPEEVVIIEEPAGVRDAQSVVVSFLAPAVFLTYPGMMISLCVKATPITTLKFMSKLGPELAVFTCPLSDTAYVHVIPRRPGLPQEVTDAASSRVLASSRVPASSSRDHLVAVLLSATAVSTLSRRIDLSKAGFDSALSTSVIVNAHQRSPCTVELSVDEKIIRVSFPYPVNGKDHKLRIARKSLYVDVSPSLYEYLLEYALIIYCR
jgi:hypothetical protein